MKKWLVYACENQYGGLHGIEDYTVIEAPDDWDEDFIYSEYIPEMSEQVMESYGDIMDDLVNREDCDSEEEYWDALGDAIRENTCGYVAQVRDDVKESAEKLDRILCRLGHELFREEYCVN